MFHEDDVFPMADHLMIDCIRYQELDHSVGFVSLAPICDPPVYSGGGFGVTSVKKLEEVTDRCGGSLPHNLGKTYLDWERAEVAFTNIYVKLGYEVKNLPGSCPLPKDWDKHLSQNRYGHLYRRSDRQVYKVGVV